MKQLIFIISTLAMFNTTGLTAEKLYQTIPKEIFAWKAEEKDEYYNRETLYEHINGGAELYLTYDFQQVFVRRFIKPDTPEIELEIYDMST